MRTERNKVFILKRLERVDKSDDVLSCTFVQ